MNVLSNATFPLTNYLASHRTELKLLVLFLVARYIHNKRHQIKQTWQDTAYIRTIFKFGMNQYFQTPSSKDIMQEQREKYDSLYTQHYSRNATTIACKFSLNSIESLISNTFNPKMKAIRSQLQSLNKKNGKNMKQLKAKKYELFKQLFCIGVCRSICLIFMNTLYHNLLHIIFAMIARRNLYKNNTKSKQPQQSINAMDDKRKLFEIITVFHHNLTGLVLSLSLLRKDV